MDFGSNLLTNIKASSALNQIISNETLRIRAECGRVAEQLNWQLYIWTSPFGLTKYPNETLADPLEQPHEVLEWILEGEQTQNDTGILLLLEDFHHFLTPTDHQLINRLRAFAMEVASRRIANRSIVLSQPFHQLPVELEKETQVLEMPLPTTEELAKLLEQAKQKYHIDDRDYDQSESLLEAALGLSTSEAQLAFAKIACQFKRLTENDIPHIVKEKEQVIRKSGHLEYFHPKANLQDIGGLDNLKNWLNRRRQAFTQDAQKFGLEKPRGVLLLGLPGTGKSLAAKAVANAWQLPLLRLDMGKIYGGIVGQSEANMRAALQTAEALSPCILWVDEIEKGLSGMQSSGSTDGGTTARVLGTFLTWMQEKEKPVFVVATANHIAQLPPELLRKGRVDEIFFVDLPTQTDRKAIIHIHLRKRDRAELFDEQQLEHVAQLSAGFTGAELEEAIKEAMFIAYDAGHELSVDDIQIALNETLPLSKTMSEMIKQTRQWAKGRAVMASVHAAEPLPEVEHKRPRLIQEGENPFI
ncbi:AAA family ATPase [Vibrio sp. PNB22_8_1]|uniref:AAA family ATPase n=1 Tax=unclassified Vibrio TaxID=2614977 RepID=UPI00406A3734